MSRRLLPAILLLALAVPVAARAGRELTPAERALIFGYPGSVSTAGRQVRIPLEGTDDRGFYKCPYMRVFVDGHGPFTFLFDTGAAYTIVTTKVTQAANVPVEVDRGGRRDLVRIKELKIGDLAIKDLVAVRDDDFGVDGVFGFKAFGDMNLVFELHDRLLLVSPDTVSLPERFEVPYQLALNIPTVPVTVGDSTVEMLLDTGDDAYPFEVRTEDLKGATLAHPPLPAEEVLNGAKASPTSVSTLKSKVRFGPLTIDHAVVGINDALPVPDFGVDYLKEFNFEFEPRRMIVAFQPLTSGSGTRIAGNPSAGFTLHFDGNGIVSSVVPGSAASKRGMHSGDRILSINGKPMGDCNPRTWDRALGLGRPLELRWVQGKEERKDTLKVEELH